MTPATRIASLGLVATILAGIAGSGWIAATALSRDIAEASAHLEAIEAQHARATHRRATSAAALDPRLFLAGQAQGAAAAHLQATVMAMANASGVAVKSVAARAVDPTDGRTDVVGRVAVDLVAVADTPSLRALLHRVETGIPIMSVTRLSIAARAADDDGEPGTHHTLRELDVELRIESAIAPTGREGS